MKNTHRRQCSANRIDPIILHVLDMFYMDHVHVPYLYQVPYMYRIPYMYTPIRRLTRVERLLAHPAQARVGHGGAEGLRG